MQKNSSQKNQKVHSDSESESILSDEEWDVLENLEKLWTSGHCKDYNT